MTFLAELLEFLEWIWIGDGIGVGRSEDGTHHQEEGENQGSKLHFETMYPLR